MMPDGLTITRKPGRVDWQQQHSEPCTRVACALFVGFAIISALLCGSIANAEETVLRDIPGITTADQFPGACVDCHVNMPDRKMDVRIGTLMKQWYEKVDPKIVKRVQTTMPGGRALKGRHPVLPADGLRDIPASCRSCHRSASREAPPLGPMLHVLHLTGGAENHYIKLFGGACTYCHKFDAGTGQWKLPSGPEK